MATITITVPNPVVPRINDAFAATYQYQSEIDGAPNPETKSQFTQRMIRKYVKEIVKAHEAHAAGEAARLQAQDAAESEITLS